MGGGFSVWLQFLLCAAVIFFAGTRLSRYGDVIAEKSGLGRTWIGVILMASVTSLPELITGFSSVVIFDLPDIAAGDVLGSCMFNLLILAFLDFQTPSTPVSSRAHHGHILTAGFGVVLLSIAATGIVGAQAWPTLGWFGLYSVVFLAVYAMAMRAIYIQERRRLQGVIRKLAEEGEYRHISARRAYSMYAANAVLVIAAATFLPGLGEQIAGMTGLGGTFVGTLFIAMSTSLPEIVVSASAMRIGSVDLAVGNLLGSNLFNIAILGLDDIFYVSGPLLARVSASHVISALGAILMTGIAMAGLQYRTERKRLILAWDSTSLVLAYGAAIYLLYRMR